MGDLNKIVSNIQGNSGAGDLKELKTFLNKSEEALVKNLNHLDDALNALDVFNHSLGWLYILSAKAGSSKVDPQRLISQIQFFLQSCNPIQVRAATSKFCKVCRKYTDILIELRQPMRGILPLKAALAVLSGISKQITPIHTDIVQLCLLAKCYRTALPIIEEDLYEVDQEETGITPKDLLAFYYYGGRVFIGMKKFRRASEFFKQVFTSPAVALSAITVDSYKKYIIVSLIAFGQVPVSPKYTSTNILRQLKHTCGAYMDLSTAYQTHNIDDIQKCINSNAELYQKDGNFGLVKQCIAAFTKSNIKRHTQTYLTLSIGDISKSVKDATPKQAEQTLLRMIEDNEIYAVIDQRDGMVSFHDSPEHYNTNSMLQHLDGQIDKILSIDKKLRSLDETLALTPAYIQKVSGQDRSRWNSEQHEDAGFQDIDKPGFAGKFS